MSEDETFGKVREFVRQEQERRGREDPVRFDEICEAVGIDEGTLYEMLAPKIMSGELVGMDLFVTFAD